MPFFSSSTRATFSAILLGALLATFAGSIAAQNPPRLRILVGFPPGGGTDVVARYLAEPLGRRLGMHVLVENKAGAGGQLAAQALKTAPADGMTILLSHDHAISILPLVMKNPGYVPQQDFVAVAGIASFVNAMALSANTPATSFTAYLAWLKTQGAPMRVIGIPAPASTPEFLVKTLAARFAPDLAAAAYRGGAPMIMDMLGNQIPAGIGSIPEFIEHHRDGRLRIIAVLGRQRQAALPTVPTLAELGVEGFEDMPYYGFFAPTGTPATAIARLSAAISEVLAEAAVRDRLVELGLTVEHQPPARLAQQVTAYTRAWADIIRRSGFQPQ